MKKSYRFFCLLFFLFIPISSWGKIPYLTFSCEGIQTLMMSKKVETLEYSVNNGGWQTLGENNITFGGTYGDLRLRGLNPNGTAYSSNEGEYSHFIFGTDGFVYCSGDIRTLVNYEDHENADCSNARFCWLFKDCKALKTSPELPSTKLADHCYYAMFYHCISLFTVPQLPAKILSDFCYTNIFTACESITDPPVLPATQLATSCYGCMFMACKNLRKAPELPAKELAERCYSHMFSDCESLIDAPELPAIVLAPYCYECMFDMCHSLTRAPSLPAMDLSEGCYAQMFSSCLSLSESPVLPAVELAPICYCGMFSFCQSLEKAPILPAPILEHDCYNAMFVCCPQINEVIIMAEDINAKNCLLEWLSGTSAFGLLKTHQNVTWDAKKVIPEGWTIETNSAIPSIKLAHPEEPIYHFDGTKINVISKGFSIVQKHNGDRQKVFLK